MTFHEIELTLPNGFHDADILAVNFDALQRIVTLSISINVSNEGHGKPLLRPARLTASGVALFFIEPPEMTYPHQLGGDGISASGDDQLNGLEPNIAGLIAKLDHQTDRYRFFLNDWNSFLYVAARSVTLTWMAPA